MGEHKRQDVFGKVRIAFVRNEGLPSRIEYSKDFDAKRMGNAEVAIMGLFINGLHNLCDTCRNAMREIRIATDTAKTCPRRKPDGLCKDSSHPCNAKCKVIAEAINKYREEVNANASKDAGDAARG